MRAPFARGSALDEAARSDFFAALFLPFALCAVLAVAANASAGATAAVATISETATETAVPSATLCIILSGANNWAFIRVRTKRREVSASVVKAEK
ncbi:hypothetical protein BMMON3_14910 [Burkholderia mallei]